MQTCNIMGVNIAVTDMDKTLRLVEDNCEAWRGKYICVANVHTTVTAYDDPTYLRVQNGAVMALPDGGPLSRYSRKKGFADAARVTGPDLMRELLKESGTKHYRHYFYGSTQETLDIFFATVLVILLSRSFAVYKRCPVTVFLIAGIFPLVPGSGIYWTAFYVVTNDLERAGARGFLTLKDAVAIVLGILLVFEFPQSWFRKVLTDKSK